MQTRNVKVGQMIIYHYVIIEMSDGAKIQFVLIKQRGVYSNQ